MDLFIGIDLGGTNIKAGVVDQVGNVLGKVSVSTGRGPDAVIENMARAARGACDRAGVGLSAIAAAGVASPGPLSTAEGVLFRPANLPGFVNVPLRARIGRALGLPTVLENDANAAAYGEFWAGAGKGNAIQDLVIYTFGTGIGGGIVNDGRVVHGMRDFAAELGHVILIPDGEPCGCGQRGCFEAYASASRVGMRATAALRDTGVPPAVASPFGGQDARPPSRAAAARSSLQKVLAANGAVSSHDVVVHAAAGDTFAQTFWDDTCRLIGLACVNTVHWMDPHMIVLAGGMAEAGAALLDPVRRHFENSFWKLTPPGVRIALPLLGNDVGLVGAAGIAVDCFTRDVLTPIGT